MQPRSTASFSFTRLVLRPQTSWFTIIAPILVCGTLLSQFASAQAATQTPPAVVDGSAKLVQHANPSQMLRVVLGLERPHPDQEEVFLSDLHTKGTKEYRHFLTQQEWNARFGPSPQDEQAVVDWATSHGLKVTNRYPHRLVVDVEGSISTIEAAFNVKINNYQIGAATHFSNDRDPSISGSTASLVHSVIGLNDIQVVKSASGRQPLVMPIYSPGPVKGAMASGHADGDHRKYLEAVKASKNRKIKNDANGLYGPTDIYGSTAYDFNALYARGHCCNPFGNPGGTPAVTSIAVFAIGAQNVNDFAGFQAQYPYLAYHYFTIPINGVPVCCDPESTMDFEWATAMSNSFGAFTDTASVYIYQGANNLFSTYTTIYSQMLADGNARTMSVSYGCAEFSCFSSSVMDTEHGVFNAMVGQGWTLVAAAGDQGTTADCSTVSVSYPGSDPDVVSAGGTKLITSPTVFALEDAWTGGTAPGSCPSPTNDGGGQGGCSGKFAAPGYQSSIPDCLGNRSVPDVSLNADFTTVGQNYFWNGGLQRGGGTSIVAPELAGFFAQENAYLYYENVAVVGNTCGSGGNGTCAPMGNPNWYMYYEALNAPYAGHYPFYDITSGCTSNDVTIAKGISPWCAFAGYDLATGWGSFNALQLSWSINTYLLGDFGAPNTTFSGPATNTWYNSNQIVSWGVTDTSGNGSPANGVAGFSQAWDSDPGDAYSHATPGLGDSFYSGPQTRNTTGCLSLGGGVGCSGGSGEGCHTVFVRSWDNAGWGGVQTYGPVCYDTIAPNTTDSASPGPNGGGWNNTSVSLTLFPSDPGSGSTGSGIAFNYYAVDNAACSPGGNLLNCQNYASPVSISTEGSHSFYFFSQDVAGNFQSQQISGVNIDTTAPVTGVSFSGTTPVVVTLSASDNLSGVATTVYQLDGGAANSYTGPFAVAVAGSHTVTFHSTDVAGNVESTKSAGFKVLAKSATAVTSTPNPSTYGQAVTFTASVTPATATGTVTFMDGAATLGTVGIAAGKAHITTSALTAGAHSITAVYSGDANFGGSTSSPRSQTVKKAPTSTTLVSSLNPSKKGQAVTLTATVAPGAGPTGSVTFKDGSKTLGTAALNTTTHKAAITKSTLSVGTHSITAAYGGNASFNTSASAVVKQVVH
jgi:hypothetical protein